LSLSIVLVCILILCLCIVIRSLLFYHFFRFSLPFFLFFFYVYGHHRDLHSFPTRRSSDLGFRLEDDLVQAPAPARLGPAQLVLGDRKSTRLNSSHQIISYAVFCLKKKKKKKQKQEKENTNHK